ncbi:type II secretion system F family protein [Tannockella kyphosi]|uniref:type II secretion system F family protein n=1 Tax=Tannockella kyphosi TaxID=2899121 RepID=UPI00201335DD|nr:type II secretion system F family protein [Tannockella kyphosi]
MPIYKYNGVSNKKKKIKGIKEAANPNDLYETLKIQGVYAFDIEEQSSPKLQFKRLKVKELADFSRQIATMQASGISVMKAVQIIKQQSSKKSSQELYDYLYAKISQGNTLSQAMYACGQSFPEMMIHMFHAGEASGKLDGAASKMAKYYDSEYKTKGKIKNALAYPIILAFVVVFVVLALFTYVLPIFFEMYEKSGTELNSFTLFLQRISNFFVNYWAVVILLIILFITAMLALRQWSPLAKKIDRFHLKIPGVGRLLSIIYTARFARTMSSLYSSGIGMIQSLEMSAKTINNHYLEEQFQLVIKDVQSGHPLSYAISDVEGMEGKLSASILVGEESGKLDSMLLSIASEYELESELAVERLLTYIEPGMIIVMAGIIGPILVAVMLPMFDMYSMIG